jgi:hypothetical protein
MTKMYRTDWDPYDVILELASRLDRLESAHNRLSEDYIRSQRDLTVALESIRNLQHHQRDLANIMFDTNTRPKRT